MPEMEIETFIRDPHSALELTAQEDWILTEDGKPKFRLRALDDAEAETWEELLMKDPRFIARMEHSRKQIESGQTVAFEDIEF
ncbi:MAG: hypothetical protein HYZ00_14380 [Candidatus Hydrogenedentes bacterium]|nr:hypothetical protein [Candidatus Hydrogenedentota bacterium]